MKLINSKPFLNILTKIKMVSGGTSASKQLEIDCQETLAF